MKHKSFGLKFSLVTMLFFTVLCLPAKAFLELNQELTFPIESKGIFPFSDTANAEVKKLTSEGKLLDATFTILSGGGIRISNTADGVEFGQPLHIPPSPSPPQSLTIPLDFTSSPQGTQSFGLSISPISGPTTFKILIKPAKVTDSTSPTTGITTPDTPTNGSGTSSGAGVSPTLSNKYNGVTIITTLLSESTISSLIKLINNPQCKSTAKDINQSTTDSALTSSIEELISNNLSNSINNAVIVSRRDGSENQRIFKDYKNDSSTVQLYLTGIFPSIVKDGQTLGNIKFPCIDEVPPEGCGSRCQNEGDCCGKDSEGNETHACLMSSGLTCKCLPGVVIKSAGSIKDLNSPPNIKYSIKTNKKWKISATGNAFYDPSFQECITPYCLVVENSMPIFFPNTACPTISLSNKRAIFSPIEPQNFAYIVSETSPFIQIEAFDNQFLRVISEVDRGRGFFIFQPVPPLRTIFTTIDITVDPRKLSDEPVPCEVQFDCALCGHPHITTVPEEDIPKTHCANCPSCGKCCAASPDGEVWATCGLQSQRVGSRECPCIPLSTSTRKFKCNN